jgi:hypothetical protein
MPKRLAITISGAVSLGSYEAGVLYEIGAGPLGGAVRQAIDTGFILPFLNKMLHL